jgi:tetratricopeptide (TPR) repeat protein
VRNRIRAAAAARDHPALRALADEIDPAAHPVQTVNLVAVHLYWAAGRPDAVRFLRRAHPHHPGDFQINHNLAFILLQEGQPAQALPFCAAAVAVRPGSAAGWQDYARALVQTEGKINPGQEAETVAAYRRLVALAPHVASAHAGLGNALYRTKDVAGALAAYEEVVRLDPNNALAHEWAAFLHLAAGNPAAALPYAERAVGLDPKRPMAQAVLGRARREGGDLDRAIPALREAVRLDPKPPGPRGNLRLALIGRGRTAAARGDWHAAAADYREAAGVDPADAPARAALGLAADRLGDWAGAADAYREAVRLDPKNALAHNNLAWLLATCPDDRLRDGPKAVEHASRACELTGNQNPVFVDTLAAAHAEAGDFDKAAECQGRALVLPDAEKILGAGARDRLALYARREPYRERVPAAAPMPRG